MNTGYIVLILLCVFGLGFAAAFFVTYVVGSRANNSFGRCPKCGGDLFQVYGLNRPDVVRCERCETLYSDLFGECIEVFGHPPITEGGNHEQSERRLD